ncbi:helix-turn-helix domain-containing protein [Chloroflexota bacterium]
MNDTPSSLEPAIERASHVILDGDLSAERLDAYLIRGQEEDEFDFKESFDWGSRTTKGKLEFVKDAIGMANTLGGYLIYGVHEDPSGTPRFTLRGITEEEARRFDPATLKSLIERYVRRRIEISCAVVESKRESGRRYGAIYVRRFQGGFAIPFEAEGQYFDQARNQHETVFSRGDIWVRRGAMTIKAQAEDIERLESEFRRAEQAVWLEQHFQLSQLIERMNALANSGRVSEQTTLPEPSQDLLLQTFPQLRGRFLGVLEANNEVLTRRWIQTPKEELLRLLAHLPDESAEQQRLVDYVVVPFLNSLLFMGIVCLEFDQQKYFALCVEQLAEVYQHAADSLEGQQESPRHASPMGPLTFWREVILRVYILGAIVVRLRRFGYLPKLVQQTPYHDEYWRQRVYWARHALTMLARARLLKPKSLCEMARPLVEQLGLQEALSVTGDQTQTYLAQFDFLQAIVGAHRNGRIDDTYPSFGVYYTSRVVDIARELFHKGEARSAIPGIQDDELKRIIQGLDGLAAKEFFLGGWDRTDWPPDLRKLIYEE